MKASSAGNRFGEIAVREGFAPRDAVRECLEIQTKLKSFGVEPKRIGEIMIEKGYLRDEDVRAIIDVQRLGGSRLESRSGITDLKSRVRNKANKRTKKKIKKVRNIPGYEVLDLLGEGGMGMVYRARQKSLDRIVALKILPASAAKETSFIKRFIAEARTVARLNHENIIAGIDVGEADGTYYFAMEHVEGESIAEIIERQGALEERFALQIAEQMSRALQHAHKHGLVHRDVKPQNILVTRNNLAKLCDLGLAKMQSENDTSPTGVPVGTPHYLSPEQARGEADVDIRSDVYSMGATLYHMLTGHTPFDGQSPMVLMTKHLTEEPTPPRRRDSSISKSASDLVMRMMAKDKEDRHQSPTELLEDVERVLSGKRPSGNVRKSSRRGSRRKTGRQGDAMKESGVINPGRENRLEKRSRARRGRMIHGGRSNESFWLFLIPVLLIGVVGSVVYMAYSGPKGLTPRVDGGGQELNDEADAALRSARAMQRTNPSEAAARYRDIVKRYPGTLAEKQAAQYLEELTGG
jgi:eukaryotic-like serine/threonine-protein kinase